MIKKNFYFQRSSGKYLLLAKNVTNTEAMKIMHNFLEERNYKSYYTRMWIEKNGNQKYDVGSWSEFFIWGTVAADEIEGDITE